MPQVEDMVSPGVSEGVGVGPQALDLKNRLPRRLRRVGCSRLVSSALKTIVDTSL